MSRDHGGPYQNNREIEERYNTEEAMKSAKISFEVDINASDSDVDDLILLSLVSDALPGNFSFSDAYGTGEVTSKLKWNPSCNELNDDFSDKLYELTFDVADNNCPNAAKSSKKIRFL